jgi:transposase
MTTVECITALFYEIAEQLRTVPTPRDDDGDGFHAVHVNTMEGLWSLLRSWLRPHRGISQDHLPLYLGFFECVHNVRRRGKALLGTLLELLRT